MKTLVKNYYDQEASQYIDQYQKETSANSIRLEIIVKRLKEIGAKTILDVGCGTCGPMIRLLNEGFDVKGFDFSDAMLKEGRKNLKEAGYGDVIFKADIDDHRRYWVNKWEIAIALGVFPHVENEARALKHIRKSLNTGGIVFIEFRNLLFSLFSMNGHSLEFFMNTLIDQDRFRKESVEDIRDYLEERFNLNRERKESSEKLSYSDIQAKFHNPLTIGRELFNPNGFKVNRINFYHYHALPPFFETKYPEEFKRASLMMENPEDWRGYFMASAFVVEAQKNA